MNDKSHSPYMILTNVASHPPRLWRALQGPVYTIIRRPAVDPTLLALAALARLAQEKGEPSCQAH